MGFLREVLILDIRVEFITEMSVYILWGKSAQGYPKFEVRVEIRQISHFLCGIPELYNSDSDRILTKVVDNNACSFF